MGRSEQGKENQSKYIKRYIKEHYEKVIVQLKIGDDDDVIRYLDSQKSKSSAIRRILKEAIASRHGVTDCNKKEGN